MILPRNLKLVQDLVQDFWVSFKLRDRNEAFLELGHKECAFLLVSMNGAHFEFCNVHNSQETFCSVLLDNSWCESLPEVCKREAQMFPTPLCDVKCSHWLQFWHHTYLHGIPELSCCQGVMIFPSFLSGKIHPKLIIFLMQGVKLYYISQSRHLQGWGWRCVSKKKNPKSVSFFHAVIKIWCMALRARANLMLTPVSCNSKWRNLKLYVFSKSLLLSSLLQSQHRKVNG